MMTQELHLIQRECATRLHEWVRQLPECDRRVCEWRYGLGADGPMTFREIGVRCGLSTVRVFTRHGRVMRTLYARMREECARDGWTNSDELYGLWHTYQNSEE